MTKTPIVHSNSESDLAYAFVNDTNQHIFLTGKAGTGKTTFLKNLLANTTKKTVVVAPTGVAAINAGGSTIHSMFGLPTRAFVPSNESVDPNMANNAVMIREHFHYNKVKRDIFQSLELLVIDEISMVRADLFDVIDHALRFARNSSKPFGGVQLLLIGDLLQLPPVVTEMERGLIFHHYATEFFFSAKCFPALELLTIELKTIYRQSDRNFINLLNQIRSNQMESWDYENLAERIQPEFQPQEPGWITLTTHNKQADAINEKELEKIEAAEKQYVAKVSGEFSEGSFPTEGILRIKEGAQVMFVKNDASYEKRFYNGKIGTVLRIAGDTIFIDCNDGKPPIEIERETWKNLRYKYNSADETVEQEEVGSFEQFPLRLAWAITVHKSQGLTFEKAMIDAGKSFAPGQVYVALSRCTNLESLILMTAIRAQNIMTDARILHFHENQAKTRDLYEILEEKRQAFHRQQLLEVYSVRAISYEFNGMMIAISKEKSSKISAKYAELSPLRLKFQELEATAQKFQRSIAQIFKEHESQFEAIDRMPTEQEQAESIEALSARLQERCTKAGNYFADYLSEQIIEPVRRSFNELNKGSKPAGSQKIRDRVGDFQTHCWAYIKKLYKVKYGETPLYISEDKMFIPQE
jgi:hypothetical protein